MSESQLDCFVVNMPNEGAWSLKPFAQLCSIISRGTAPLYVESSDVMAIGQRCVTSSGFNAEFARPHSRRAMRDVLRPQSDDVLLNSTGTGTIGRSAVFSGAGDFIVDSHVTLLRPRPGAAKGHWLNAMLCAFWTQRHLERFCYSGSTNQIELGREPLRASLLPAPPIVEQSAIVRVLDTLDTAIHESEAIIAKLTALKQGLLYDLLTRGIDANGQVRSSQAEAPHLYQTSPLGCVPRDWTIGKLGAWLECKPKNGYSPTEAAEWTGIQMLGLGCLTPDGFSPSQLKRAPQRIVRVSGAMLSEGDLLVSRSNTRELVGLVGIYSDVGTPCFYPDLMMRLTPSIYTSARFLEILLRSTRIRRQIQAHAVGTSGSMVKISGSIVSNLAVAMPNIIEQSLILDRVDAVSEMLNTESVGLVASRAIRSGLMDDLLTGRVRVTALLPEDKKHEAEEYA